MKKHMPRPRKEGTDETKAPTTDYYIPSTLEHIHWGYLPNREATPILTVPSGAILTFDTVSHEGLLEDQGRDPVRFFGQYGIDEELVLAEAKAIAASNLPHDFFQDGPHIVTGPVAVEGAQPGDVLKVEVLSLQPRVPYGVISNRHYKGALPGEYPKRERWAHVSVNHPESYGDVSVFCPICQENGGWYAKIEDQGRTISFPLRPFWGIMGVAPNTNEKVSSVPPSRVGGNLDINELGVGATLYLPIEVVGALFYVGDPHFAQGNGEVALTALEGSLRGTVRVTVLKAGELAIPQTTFPFVETETHWVPIGLEEDLNEAMKQSVRESIHFLSHQLGLEAANVYAYLSAGVDYEVSQVVDQTKGIHARIPKMDCKEMLTVTLHVRQCELPVEVYRRQWYIALEAVMEALGYQVIKQQEGQRFYMVGEHTIGATVDSLAYQWEEQTIVASAAPVVSEGGVALLPIAALTEVLGVVITWSTVGAAIHGVVYEEKF